MKKKTLILALIVALAGTAAALAFVSKTAAPTPADPIRGRSSTALIEADVAAKLAAPAAPAPAGTIPAVVPAPTPAPSAAAPANLPVETPAFASMLSKTPDAHSTVYVVHPGDNLTVISRKSGATIDLIKKINGLKSDVVRPNMKLKIPNYKFSVVVDKSQNSLILKGDEEVLKTYVVSTGAGNKTPVGVFKITDKVVNPVWYKNGRAIPHESPENLLGTRWLGLTEKGYGIHGTVEPEKLGQQVTEGCVRMRNEEVEELYSYLPAGTEVTIVD